MIYMTARSSILILALVVCVPVVAGAQAQSRQQRQAAAQLAEPKLDSNAIVAALDLTATPLKDVVAAIAKAGGITVRYHSGVTNLDAVSAVKLSNAKVEDALHTALDPKGLAFKVTGEKSVFIYPDTPANREKYTESIRTFPIAKADVDILVQMLNQAAGPFGADDLRPTFVSLNESRTISVRATPDIMARIAKLIADNDK